MLISILIVLSILTAVSSLTVVYQGGTDSGLHPHTCLLVHPDSGSSLSDYIVHNTVHTLIHVILISAYLTVRVKFYAYVNMLVITNLLFAGKKSSLQTCNYAKGRNQRRDNANDSFGKGFDVLKDHVLHPFNDWALPALHHCSYSQSSTRFFSKIA